MSDDKRINNNDFTTGDRLYDSGVATDGSLLDDAPPASDPHVKKIGENSSTYAANAVAETVEPDSAGGG